MDKIYTKNCGWFPSENGCYVNKTIFNRILMSEVDHIRQTENERRVKIALCQQQEKRDSAEAKYEVASYVKNLVISKIEGEDENIQTISYDEVIYFAIAGTVVEERDKRNKPTDCYILSNFSYKWETVNKSYISSDVVIEKVSSHNKTTIVG